MNLQQYSTKSGFAKIAIGFFGMVAFWFDKDMAQFVLLAGFIMNGLMGVKSKD